MSEIIIAKQGGEGLYEEKKSRFIAKLYPINNEEEAAAYLEAARKKYWDARHNCYAYVIGDNNDITRCSDDGEPSGTAGRPILEVILGEKIHNCMIIVTRYFGGTLLGTGGLVRAYTKSAKDACADSVLVIRTEGIRYLIETDYSLIGKIQYIAAAEEVNIEDTEYGDKVIFKISVRKDHAEAFCKRIIEDTNAKALITEDEKVIMEYKNNC